jgi:hypothetical protein
MSLTPEWSIQSRALQCAATGTPFQDGEYFYTLLYHDKDGYRREDLSETAYQARNDNIQPFSLWRSKFETPPPAPPEPLAKQTAEDLLRSYMNENSPTEINVCYLLAVMLERKKLLKEIETKNAPDGQLTRIYEHTKTGEVFVIPDPGLRLDQIAQVQQEVAGLLG